MAPRLVALDLDGTLVDRAGKIPDGSLAALRRVTARGIQVAVCTGRSVGATRHLCRRLQAELGRPIPAVACNGAAVLDAQGQVLTLRAMPAAPLLAALDILRQANLLLAVYGPETVWLEGAWRHLRAFVHDHHGRPWPLCYWHGAAGAWRFFRRNRARVVRNLSKHVAAHPVRALKVFALHPDAGRRRPPGPETADSGVLADVVTQLEQRVPSLQRTSSAGGNLELMAGGAHKGWGLRTLAEVLRVPSGEVMAVGDGHNDLEMFAYAGLSVAMGDAPPEVQAGAGSVTAPFAADGLALALERFCLGPD